MHAVHAACILFHYVVVRPARAVDREFLDLHVRLFVITSRPFHPPLPVVDSIEWKAAFFLKRVKTAIADTELVGEAVYYHAVWNGWFNRYFICGLTGIGKRKPQAPVITYLKDRNLIDIEANWIRPLDRPLQGSVCTIWARL